MYIEIHFEVDFMDYAMKWNFEQVHQRRDKTRRDEKRKAKWSQSKPSQARSTKRNTENTTEIKTKTKQTQNNYDNKKAAATKRMNNGEPLFVVNVKYTNMNCSAVDDVLISALELWQWNGKNKITPILLSTVFIPCYNENTHTQWNTFICCSTLCFVWSN